MALIISHLEDFIPLLYNHGNSINVEYGQRDLMDSLNMYLFSCWFKNDYLLNMFLMHVVLVIIPASFIRERATSSKCEILLTIYRHL